jgi:hypothetical protein
MPRCACRSVPLDDQHFQAKQQVNRLTNDRTRYATDGSTCTPVKL